MIKRAPPLTATIANFKRESGQTLQATGLADTLRRKLSGRGTKGPPAR
jgi:hypothetical protein